VLAAALLAADVKSLSFSWPSLRRQKSLAGQ